MEDMLESLANSARTPFLPYCTGTSGDYPTKNIEVVLLSEMRISFSIVSVLFSADLSAAIIFVLLCNARVERNLLSIKRNKGSDWSGYTCEIVCLDPSHPLLLIRVEVLSFLYFPPSRSSGFDGFLSRIAAKLWRSGG